MVFLFIYPFTCVFIHFSIYLCIHEFIYLFIYVFIYLYSIICADLLGASPGVTLKAGRGV